jgi:hypothetical protein
MHGSHFSFLATWYIKTHIKDTKDKTKHFYLLILTSLFLIQILIQILFMTGGGTCNRRKSWILRILCWGRRLCGMPVSAKSNRTCIPRQVVDPLKHIEMVSIEMGPFHPMNADLMSKGGV